MSSRKDAASKKRKSAAASSSREPFEDEPLSTLFPLAHDIGNFGSRERYNDFKRCMNPRQVLSERVFPDDILAKLHFPYTARLKQWDWYDLMDDTSTRVLSDVVKSFYFNAKPKPDHIESSFHGNIYRIYRKDIARAIGRRLQPGNRIFKAPDNYPWVEACRQIWADPRIQVMQTHIEGLPLEHRILHLIVAQVNHPKRGSFDRVDPIEVYLMHKIINNEPFDLVEVILSHILHAMNQCKSSSNNYSLPYGKTLTYIIRRKVANVNKDDVSAPWKLGPLSLKTVRLMGWQLDPRTNTWRRKEEIAAEALNEAQDEDYNPQEDEMADDDDDVNEEEDEEAANVQENEGAQEEQEDREAVTIRRLDNFMLSQEEFNDYRVNNIEDQMLTRFERLSMENEYLRMQNDHQIAFLASIGQALHVAPPTPMAPLPEYPPLAYSNRYSPAPNPYFYPDEFHPSSPPYNPDT